MEKNTNKQAKDNTVKQRLQDILLSVSWRDIANTYFDRSASWLYHKLDGIDGNGGVGGFILYYFLRHYKGTTNFRITQVFTTLFCSKYKRNETFQTRLFTISISADERGTGMRFSALALALALALAEERR